MPDKLLITFTVVDIGHDGYCSGNECEYDEHIETRVIDMPMGFLYRAGDELLPEHLVALRNRYELTDDYCWDNNGKSNYCEKNNFPHEYSDIPCNTRTYFIKRVEVISVNDE